MHYIAFTTEQARRAVELVSALQLISDRDGPSVYFSFSGSGSAIALPPIKTWPNSTGFTFTTWVRFERICMKASDTYRPFLYTFRTTHNQGYLAYFGENTLCLESTDTGGAVVSKHECPFPAELFQWYMVTVSVVKNQMRKSQVSVYINGDLASSGTASFSELLFNNNRFIGTFKLFSSPQPFRKCYVGSSDSLSTQTCFSGQVCWHVVTLPT